MKVLVVYASKYNSTKEIADAIGFLLGEQGITTTVKEVSKADGVTAYDAVVVGSAVYGGRWLKPAYDFVERHAQALSHRPTWLFSSGPLGKPLKPKGDEAVDIETLVALTQAHDHHIFAGKLDKSQLSFAEKAIVFAVRGKEGDFRDWDDITAWALRIASTLKE